MCGHEYSQLAPETHSRAGGGAQMMFEDIQKEWRQKYRTYTDLALEAREVIVQHEGPPEIPGVAVDTEKTEYGTISRVSIMTDEGARAMGKMPGNYSTLEVPALRERDRTVLEKIAELVALELQRFLAHLQVPAEGDVLVVGLGNWNATPDALGPRTVHHLVVTRHFYYMATPQGRQGIRPVAALSPGVLGITGIETAEIVLGLVQQIKPALVICVDALAARSTERLATTIQIADAGIQPGSGVGNKRFGITRDSLGVPVIAIGVPTVVHALTVVADGLEKLESGGNKQQPPTSGNVGVSKWPTAEPVGRWPLPDPNLILKGTPAATPSGVAAEPVATAASPAAFGNSHAGRNVNVSQKRQIVQDVLEPYMGDLIMTPKEVDVLIEDVAETIAESLNIGLHADLDLNRLILSAIRA